MTKTDLRKELLLLLLFVAPLIYMGLEWRNIPDVFGQAAEPVQQQIKTKEDFLLLMIFFFFTNALIYFLFRYLPKTDDEAVSDPELMHREYYKVRYVIQIFLSAIAFIIILMVQTGHTYAMERWAFIGIGLLMAGVGLYLKGLKPNNYVGVRTPWTLKDPVVWKKTHAMASSLWTAVGLVLIAGAFFMSLITGVFVIFASSFLLPILPYIYSFRLANEDKG
ncbi:MAG: SdpI family protein [Chitinophaga sp.]|uniref:SdpI family protein n=1 Tax=Chitinophaga sp. TaxID=1869181 RepID=UPI0025C20CAB|nr:SdpI family protein [Chitinophaga sp.]MBV8253831.1 SdpI family protein [Chitinophaga sp.]